MKRKNNTEENDDAQRNKITKYDLSNRTTDFEQNITIRCNSTDNDDDVPTEEGAGKVKPTQSLIETPSMLYGYPKDLNFKEFERYLMNIDDPKEYNEAVINAVLGFFNKYLNNIAEVVGYDTTNEVKDDGIMPWHAEKIGSGGFGTILKVTKRLKSSKPMISALKVIPLTETTTHSEALHSANLNHPNVVKVFHTAFIRHANCIEMEYLEKGSLLHNIDMLPSISSDVIFKMLFQCCKVLKVMKQNGIVHADIKPENILIKDWILDDYEIPQTIDIALADFGLASTSNTRIRGTIEYCPPELLETDLEGNKKFKENFRSTFLSDLYSLGLTFKKIIGSRESYLNELLNQLTANDPNEREQRFNKVVGESAVTLEDINQYAIMHIDASLATNHEKVRKFLNDPIAQKLITEAILSHRKACTYQSKFFENNNTDYSSDSDSHANPHTTP